MNKQEIMRNLANFIGTGHYYSYGSLFNNYMTDGTKYLADNCKCYWLFDAIDTLIIKHKIKLRYVFSTMTVDLEEMSAELKIEKDKGEIIASENIEYTDFPLSKIEIWSQIWSRTSTYIHMLPTEY